MIRLDVVDERILEALKEGTKNLNQLWIKSFAREGQESFRRRIDRLEKLNLITMDTSWKRRSAGYLIELK